MPPLRGSGEMPIIPFFLEKSMTLLSDNWCLITAQKITESED